MINSRLALAVAVTCVSIKSACGAAVPEALQVGRAFHAFDHLGNTGDQADAAAAAGFNIIYVSGLGSLGYEGLPPESEYNAAFQRSKTYIQGARRSGVKLAIGYVCATSIVKLNSFDKNWPTVLRKALRTPPASWRQQDAKGNPLKSWYGGDYEPACMNNPDWRAYEHFIVKQQLDSGCDGIFFDNPTVHPQGCYCEFCMRKFYQYVQQTVPDVYVSDEAHIVEAMRQYAGQKPTLFLKFRGQIGAEFLADMRAYARAVKRSALITANNSLNSPEVLLSQVRNYGYNIHAMSEAEDFVVVEDMGSMPRALANGQTMEYGPSYQELLSVSHGKPIVAVTIADADYQTSPNLVRLALAEASANQCSYLGWPTWPENQRARMIRGIRPEIEFLKREADLLRGAVSRTEVAVYLPFVQWTERKKDPVLDICRTLSRNNVQYSVICEDQLAQIEKPGVSLLNRGFPQIALVPTPESLSESERQSFRDFTAMGGVMVSANSTNWLQTLDGYLLPRTLAIPAQPYLRGRVFQKSRRIIVQLLNLNVRKKSSFDDDVFPAADVHVDLKVARPRVKSVRVVSADAQATTGKVVFTIADEAGHRTLHVTIPRIDISSILIVDE